MKRYLRHMTLSDRIVIESGIYKGESLRKISERIRKHPGTVSREIQRNRTLVKGERPRGKNCSLAGTCRRKNLCDDEYCSQLCSLCHKNECQEICSLYKDGSHCRILEKKPFVCNTCKQRRKCKSDRAYYIAQQAHAAYQRQLKESRKGIRTPSEKLREMEEILLRLLKKGQPLSHIHTTNRERLGVCEKTLYNYIASGELSVRNIHLRRKVTYKERKKKGPDVAANQKCRQGRTYEEYQKYVSDNPCIKVVEMDTIKGSRAKGKRLLTLLFRESNLMLMFLMPDGKADSVIQVFDYLTSSLGKEAFSELFPVILTDNGSEFKKVQELEFTIEGSRRTRIFYCDPLASWQKAQIEKNHVYIRYVIPKGVSLNPYTQEDIRLLADHINSTIRPKMNYQSPYELADSPEMKKMLRILGFEPIRGDEVYLKPDLFKN